MDIVEEIRNDREKGARLLESEYKAGLLTLASRLCNDPSDAEELVNRTFAAVLEGIDGFLEQSAFFTWMCRILVRCHAKDERRASRRNESAAPETVEAAADEGAADRILREVDASLLRDAVKALPPDIRRTVVMHYFLDVPVREVARVMAIPVGTIAWRLHYARMLLAAKLGATRSQGARLVLLGLLLAAGLAVASGVVSLTAGLFDSRAERAEDFDSRAERVEIQNAAEGGFERARNAFGTSAEPASKASEGGLEHFNPSTQLEATMNTRSILAATASLALAAAPATAHENIPVHDSLSTVTSAEIRHENDAVAASRAIAAGAEFLVNGDFESGSTDPGWTGGLVGSSSSPFRPNPDFISGTWCGIIQRPNSMTQVFTNDTSCYARLSWKCTRRADNGNPVYYTVTIDGNVVWPEEKVTGSDFRYRKVDNIKLRAGEHSLVFQVRTDNDVDSTLFLDDVSLQNTGTTITELLVNGDFESGSNDPGWTGGLIGNSYSPYGPNHETTFISGNWCGIIQMDGNKTQVFTNDVPYVATLSWKCKCRTYYNGNPMYYTVTIDGNVVWPEEQTTGSDVRYRKVEDIVLKPGVHTLVFQGRTDNNADSSMFLDDVSLWVTARMPTGTVIVVR